MCIVHTVYLQMAAGTRHDGKSFVRPILKWFPNEHVILKTVSVYKVVI